ncbi:geranylgeranylglyceryl/heptaprenylglyceryl phosphate synthase [Flavobacteriaceae sp. LMIT009]
MKGVYNDILAAKKSNKKLLTILIDPDKTSVHSTSSLINKVNQTKITHIFVGGSTVEEGIIDGFISEIKKNTELPILIFPGNVTQISNKADALLFLSLISGRNPEYLIGKQVEAVSKLKDTQLEVIPTGYLLIENGKETAVQRVSETKPMLRKNVQLISDTAKAGELLGMKLIYLEAGSGAKHSINSEIISKVKSKLKIPLIVGGGMRTLTQINNAYTGGADMVVIGTAFEEDQSFLDELRK